MSVYGDTRMDLKVWAAKILGSIVGVGISMIMIAPRSVQNGIYRAFLGTVAGIIFAPATQRVLWFLDGDELEFHVAAACATGFVVWFVLEAVARFVSSRDTLRRLLEEMVRLGGPKP